MLLWAGYLFGGSVARSRWVFDGLKLLKGCPILFWGVKAEDGLPYCCHSLCERPFGAFGPVVVRGAFAL